MSRCVELAFYAALDWITGPLLGGTTPAWQANARTIGMRAANDVVFGTATAAAAKLAPKARSMWISR